MSEDQTQLKLRKQCLNGLACYNLSYDDIVNDNWKYCGGDSGRHLNYFKLVYPDRKLPDKKKECICRHDIIDNCYITDENQILVLGNCSIKKFIPRSTRTCERCNAPHKNRIVNRCNACKYLKLCKVCCVYYASSMHENLCGDCSYGKCSKCMKKCNPDYKLCYKCHLEKNADI